MLKKAMVCLSIQEIKISCETTTFAHLIFNFLMFAKYFYMCHVVFVISLYKPCFLALSDFALRQGKQNKTIYHHFLFCSLELLFHFSPSLIMLFCSQFVCYCQWLYFLLFFLSLLNHFISLSVCFCFLSVVVGGSVCACVRVCVLRK